MSKSKVVLIISIAIAIGAFFYFDLGSYLSLDALKTQQASLANYVDEHPVHASLIYLIGYIIVTALSLPGAAILTLGGGAVFGLVWGVLLVSFASTIGATLAFLTARWLLQDTVQKKFKKQLTAINKGVEKDGGFYLFTMRLVPAFPFFMVNLLMGLTKIKTFTFFWVSQLGMFAGTIVYVNAGEQLADINSLSDILSPGLIGAFVLLGLLPLISRKIIDIVKSRSALKGYKKPEKFDTNIAVIGAGSAGLVTSYIAAAVKAKVTLIERHKMGGDCLNTGCVPSKALIKTARTMHTQRNLAKYGIEDYTPTLNFKAAMQRVHDIIAKIEPHDSVERYTKLGVDCVSGEATIISPYEVKVNDKTITAKNIVIATGARPFIPPIPGLDQLDYLTSDNIWDITDLPDRLLVLGGGPIGSELTQAFARLGSKVTQVQRSDRILNKEDHEVSELVKEKFKSEGINVLTGHEAKAFEKRDGETVVICEYNGEEKAIAFDKVLVAVGRAANTSGFGLDELGVKLSERKTVEVNDFLQTNFPNIFACGDVAGPYQFTHTAAHQAWYASVNALFGGFKKFKVDYSVIPWATFINPEVARVGLNELEAKEQDIDYEVTKFGIDDLDRAIADGVDHGFIKVLTVPGKDKILGVTIVGEHAGDLLAEYVLAMKHRLGLNKILGTIHTYPTLAESNKYVAGEWKRAHKPEKLLEWVEKFHAWRRS